ncbi:MAG: hypothetical protein IJX88_01120 [Clostridia bacterium]|nr:hypothetical protein [Clostridia bacterium]
MFDFIADLDDYFCEKYANYDKLCVLPGYRMPKMQTSEVREDGRTYAYTLPANTMRLALQEQKTELLQTLKKQLGDKTFSFSFRALGFFARIKNKHSRYGFVKWFQAVKAKYNLSDEEAGESLSIDKEIWTAICKGNFMPTKNLLLSLALTAHFNMEDTENLLLVCGYEFDYTFEKDVVISYLIGQKVFNRPMIEAAFKEYNVTNLFIKQEA